MTDQEKLEKAFDDVIWMAARYAHGCYTYAPSMVRDAVALRREVDPEWVLAPDQQVKPLDMPSPGAYHLPSDDISDIYSPINDK
jgi:hypothetical protein